jgi:hypothetical protein
MTRVIGAPRSRRRRWTFTWCLIVLVGVGMVFITGAASLPPQTQGYVELDKNATDNLTTYHLGSLLSSIKNATATSFDVCERTPTLPGDSLPPALTTPFTILIDGETMTVTGVGSSQPAAGGCKFMDPADTTADVRTYTVTRGAGATAHPAASDLTRLVTGAVAGVDWSNVYTAVTTAPPNTTNPCSAITDARACDFLVDPPGVTMFTNGSSDPQDMDQERWTDSSVPDADEILDAYAIKFQGSAVGAHQFLYFGADRFAVNGAKDMGFWFFQKSVQTKSDGTFVDETGAPAKHTNGDILLLGTFTQGGAVTTIRIFKWVGSGGSDGSLNAEGNFGDCVPGSGSQDGCDTVSNTTVPSPWAYVGKSAVAPNVIYGGGFMEGGVDLTALNLQGCFSSFMAETRSSPSLTAAQKDFTLGRFESCGATVVTTPKDGAGNDIPAGGLSIGTGSVTVKDSALLTVTGTSDFTGTMSFFICGPITSPATCSTGGVSAGSVPANANGTYVSPNTTTLTSAGRYCWRAVFSSATPGLTAGASDSSTGECFTVNPVTPTLATTAVDCTTHAALTGAVAFGTAVCDKGTLGTPTSTATQPGTNGGTTPGVVGSVYPSINATNGAAAGGAITFTLRGPDSVGPPRTCSTTTATGTASPGTNPEDKTVSGNNSYFTSGFKPTSPGLYHWIAVYAPATGDPNNLGSTHNAACDNANEDVTIQQIPTNIKTQQSWIPNDTATVTAASGNLAAGGTVAFSLYSNATCSGTALYTESKTLTGGSTSEEVGTSNTTSYTITTGYTDAAGSTKGPYSWKVVYTPAAADTAHTGKQSSCDAEHFGITYTNDAGPGSNLP